MPVRPTEAREQFGHALDFIAETAAGAAIHAEIAQRYAEAGNVPGLRYAVRCMCAYIRASRGGMMAIDAAEASMRANDGGEP